MSKIKKVSPAGHRVMVKPDITEEVSKGGIIIAHENKERVDQAQVTGTVVAIGPTAWKDFTDGTPWANVGDKVLFAKFAGYAINIDGEMHRIMNDEDITGIILETEE